MIEPIKVDGLDQFVRNLRTLDAAVPKALRRAQNDAANLVVDWARPRVPRRTGRAARSVRAASTARATRVKEGGARVPYMPWLDFGGQGRKKGHPAARPFIKQGRYVWAGLAANRDQVAAKLTDALLDAARSAGVEVE